MAANHVVRKAAAYGWLAVGIAGAYSGWTMYARYREARQAEQRVKEAERERAIAAGRWLSEALGDEVKILSFAADSGVVRAGASVSLCYGVANASSVKMEPAVEGVRPAMTHCVEAFPKRTTKYTLTASDQSGKSVSASVTVRVR
ncbi:MAG TPA: hypothetical protein VKV74_17890 [Bryobacteraceae bacterium]|nr:hypothetical protein [Bryobacteraceae bacterium]